MIVTDAESGVSDFSIKFLISAKETMSKELNILPEDMTKKASEIRDKIEEAKNQKCDIQDVHFIQQTFHINMTKLS